MQKMVLVVGVISPGVSLLQKETLLEAKKKKQAIS